MKKVLFDESLGKVRSHINEITVTRVMTLVSTPVVLWQNHQTLTSHTDKVHIDWSDNLWPCKDPAKTHFSARITYIAYLCERLQQEHIRQRQSQTHRSVNHSDPLPIAVFLQIVYALYKHCVLVSSSPVEICWFLPKFWKCRSHSN